jgi:4-hydroxy-2-oxoglutarate aldolase
MLLEGIFPAVTTPFFADGQLYLHKLEQNVARYSKTAAAGLVVLGSTGEAVMLNDEESREVLRAAAGAAAPEKVLIAGVGRESVIATLKMADVAAEAGYDAVLVRTPHFYGPQLTPLAMLTFFRTVADRSSLPVILYSIPKFTHYDLPVAVIAELAHHPNILGLKDSSGNVARIAEVAAATSAVPKRATTVTPIFTAVTARMQAAALESTLVAIGGRSVSMGGAATAVASSALKTRTREVGFQVLSGSSEKLHASLAAGASGAVMAMAACAPQACHEVYVAWKEKDEPLAEEKQQRLIAPSIYVAGTLGIAGVKYACDLNGYYGGRARLPLLPLDAEQQAEVARQMQDLRN